MNIRNKNSNRTKWKEHIISWRNSALSQAEYCRRNSLDVRMFSKWKLKVVDPESDTNSFIEVPLNNEFSDLNIGLKIKSDGEIIISIKRN